MQDDCTRKVCAFEHFKFSAGKVPTSTPKKDSNLPSQTPSEPTDLPRTEKEGMVPVNNAGQRLDTLIPPPSRSQLARFKAHCKVKKLCNAFHLDGGCLQEDCEFDHRPIDQEMQHIVYYFSKLRPCNRNKNGTCRRLDCNRGHICQKPECLAAGRKSKGCFFADNLHGIDYKLHMWVPASGEVGHTANSQPEDGTGEIECSLSGDDNDVREGGLGYAPGPGSVVCDLIDL